ANFSLKDAAGKTVSLAALQDARAVVVLFIGTECPVNNLYMPRLKTLYAEFAPRGVRFLAINSNSQDSLEAVAEHARTHGLPFPVLKDADQRVAGLFRAVRTPEAFVLD